MHIRKIIHITSLLLLCISLHTNLFSQAVGDYRSRQTGNWNVNATWERYNGTNWVTANATYPYPRASNTSGVITIRNGHDVTVNIEGLEVNRVMVEVGGKISFASSPAMVTMDVLVSLHNYGTVEVTDYSTSDSRLNIYGEMINNNYVEVHVDCHLNVYGYFENNARVHTNDDSSWWGKFYVNSGGVLKCSPTSYIGGPGDFILNDEATIIIGSPDGVNAIGNNTGNIRTTHVREFNPNAYYIYDGVANQVTGTALTNAIEVTIVNTAGVVTFSRAVAMDILKIDLNAKVNLNNYTHTSGILMLPIGSYSLDRWGSTASNAENKNNVYFDVAGRGVVQLTNRVVHSFAQTTTFATCITDTAHSILVEAWGAGGKGGTRTSNGGGGGGGGGAYSSRSIRITPGDVYYITVGAGSSTTSPGGDSWFGTTSNVSSAMVLAKGGGSVSNNNTNGATGGRAADGIGTTRRSGGSGGGSGSTYGGGGGSSAGYNANGTSPSTSSSGSPPRASLGAVAPAGGGNGGNAKFSNTGPGSNGQSPGGGGGGGFKSDNQSGAVGGNGADGRVVISYEPIFPIIHLTDTHIFVCQGVTSSALHYDSTMGCPTLYMIDFSAAANDAGFQDVAYTTLPLDSLIPIAIPANAPGGIYQGVLTVKNGTIGYPSSRIFTVEVNEITFTTTGDDVSCYGSNDGSIAININSDNNSPYVFSINNGGNYNASFTGTYPNFTIPNLSPTTYKIRIRDKFGCTTKVCP